MKNLKLYIAIYILILGNNTINAQSSINLQNIFDTGINLGYLSSHAQAGTATAYFETWARNAQAEWKSSMNPNPPEFTLIQPYSNGLSVGIQHIEFSLSQLPNQCSSAWYQAANSIFRLAYSLANSYVLAGGTCNECLRNEMRTSASHLMSIFNNLQMAEIRLISQEINQAAQSMITTSSMIATTQQNARIASIILNAMNRINNILPDEDLTCSGNNVSTIPMNSSASNCDVSARNHHIYNAGFAVGLLNYAMMIDAPIERISIDGWYIDEAIRHYEASCCLDVQFMRDLKSRIQSGRNLHTFYVELSNHITTIQDDLVGCACTPYNGTALYGAGVSMGWAEFASLQNVSSEYIANNYLNGVITHLQGSQCMDAQTVINLQGQLLRASSSRPFYEQIVEIRMNLSDATLTNCPCGSDTPSSSILEETIVERTSLCGEVNEQGGDNPERHRISMEKGTGTFMFSYQTFTIPDRLQVYNGNELIFDSDCIGTGGWEDVNLTLNGSTEVIVDITPNCNGTSNTEWKFKVSCPEEVTTTTVHKTPKTPENELSTESTRPGIPSSVSTNSIPVAPIGPPKGTYWFPLESDHPWIGKDLSEIMQLGGNLQMVVTQSMAPDSYYLTDAQGKWINFNPGTYSSNTYYYIDWNAFNALYDQIETKPITNNSELYKAVTYQKKAEEKKITFKIYRQSDFNALQSFGMEIYSWAVNKSHPWYGKSIKEIEEMGAKPFMYFDVNMDYDTYIYQDPFGQLIQANGRWRNVFVIDWDRFTKNFQLVEEGHKWQIWQNHSDGKKKKIKWL